MTHGPLNVNVGPLPHRLWFFVIPAVFVVRAIVSAGVHVHDDLTWSPTELRCHGNAGDSPSVCALWHGGKQISQNLDGTKVHYSSSVRRGDRSCVILDTEKLCVLHTPEVERIQSLGPEQSATFPTDGPPDVAFNAVFWAASIVVWGGLAAAFLVWLMRSRRRTVVLTVTRDAIRVEHAQPKTVARSAARETVHVAQVEHRLPLPLWTIRYESAQSVELVRFVSFNRAELEPFAAALREALDATRASP